MTINPGPFLCIKFSVYSLIVIFELIDRCADRFPVKPQGTSPVIPMMHPHTIIAIFLLLTAKRLAALHASWLSDP